ncbi:multiple epidermal growth factor-like domains protein 10 [Haliotis rubra]|uniref:multiple epidermal growth factor-like domains protein 10 n=1 Tax=Haliotis rubra TaxID=36100 RepID=UPI001EE56452|nr:multiple epidermal growth factor-like domains protein 10 [Haliotis rubra]
MRLQEHFEVFFLLLASSECRQQHCGKNKWGPDCSKSCPENCLDLKGVVHCHISTSECLEGCIAGWYGDLCNSNCNVNCISRTCDQENGNCSLGCEVGYVCNITPDKGEAQCEVENYFICTGKTLNCLNHNCTRTQSGKTICASGCVEGFWGTSCRIPCPENCQTCERLVEKCTTCKKNQYGLFCNLTCQEQCHGFHCNQTGTCSDTVCTDGRYGDDCNSLCNQRYKTCHRRTGHCIKCKETYYGEFCELKCPHCDFKTNGKSGCEHGCNKVPCPGLPKPEGIFVQDVMMYAFIATVLLMLTGIVVILFRLERTKRVAQKANVKYTSVRKLQQY